MTPRTVSALAAAAVAAALLAIPSPASARTPRPSLGVSAHRIVKSSPVVLHGQAHGRRWLYKRTDSSWHKVRRVHGRFRVTVRPVVATSYRVGRSRVQRVTIRPAVRACPTLTNHAGVQAWFNARYETPTVGLNWARTVCSAAPGSTITLASMFIWTGGTADRILTSLETVASQRHVHVRLLVEKARMTSGDMAALRRAVPDAEVDTCQLGCSMHGAGTSMHYKFMTINRTLWGGSAVIESTLNVSPQQFDRQNGSAIYFYNNPTLYRAYYSAFTRAVAQTPATPAVTSRGWVAAGNGVAFAFDPSTSMADPISNELSTLSCLPGDYVDVVNANVTRGRMVRQLNRLRAAGCTIRLITEQLWRSQAAEYGAVRHMITHDKFVLISARNQYGPLREVITGAEDYRPASMLTAEEQLVRVRLHNVVAGYARWFSREWGLTR